MPTTLVIGFLGRTCPTVTNFYPPVNIFWKKETYAAKLQYVCVCVCVSKGAGTVKVLGNATRCEVSNQVHYLSGYLYQI
jgi:hypothetical protein